MGYIHSLTEAAGGLITILTFTFEKAQNQFVFQSVSTVKNNTDIYPPQKLITANFLRPVSVDRVGSSASSEHGGWPSLMEAFDNYGILGARLVTPAMSDDGKWNYELKGQTPALAGQMSTGLGWSDFGIGFGEGIGYIWDSAPSTA